jgi:zinc-ribbon domain
MCGIMGDPELRSDESVLLRTQGIFVKSIPFEGILTNKRIILIDRATNILPQKEIPLVTLKDFQAGENAIRDQIITLHVLAKTGETRQMILTFSRQTGGTRIKERDDWMRVLKENTSSSFEQVIRKVIPGAGQSSKKTTRAAPPRIEIISSPVSQNVPAAEKTAVKKEGEDIAPIKKIIQTSTASSLPSSAAKESDGSTPGFGTYCSRCGNRVPDVSKFCNRCGSQIVVPGNLAESKTPQATISQPSVAEYSDRTIQPIDKDLSTREPHIIPSLASVPSKTPGAAPLRPETPVEQISIVTPLESISTSSDSNLLGTDDESEAVQQVIIDSHYSESMAPSGKPSVPQKPRRGPSFKPDKKVVLGIIVVIIIVAVILGAFFIYPMIANSEGGTSDNGTTLTTIPTIVKNSGTTALPTRTLKPTATPTYRPTPGNSGSTVGL